LTCCRLQAWLLQLLPNDLSRIFKRSDDSQTG
jgi:hypothetical protein